MKKYVIGVIVLLVVIVAAVGIGIARHHRDDKTVAVPTVGSLVALGDSVAAGVGLKNDSDSSACNRTDSAYSHLVASSLNYSVKSLACTDATVPAGITGPQTINNLALPTQEAALFSESKPNVVTVTIGANDAQWTKILAECFSAECGSPADTAFVTANLTTLSQNLKLFFDQLKSHYASNPPKVVVTGYYQVLPTAIVENCTDLTGIDASELAWGRQFQTNLSNTIKTAATGYDFIKYTPIDFTGHELCTSDPWVQGTTESQPFHPTDEGQSAIASQIEKVLQ